MLQKTSRCLTALLMLAALCGCGSTHRAATADTPLPPGVQRAFDYYYLTANNLKLIEEYDAAYDMYRHCLALNPGDPAVLFELSQFCLFLNQKEEAEQMLRAAVEAAPDNYWYSQTLGAFYRNAGRTDETIALYEEMARRYPAREELLIELAGLYADNAQYKKSVEALNRIEKIEGKSEQLSTQKIKMLVADEDYESAFAEAESLAAEYPQEPQYQVILGNLYSATGQPGEAEAIYQKILSEDPGNPLVQYSLLALYEESSQDSLYSAQLETMLTNERMRPEMRVEVMRRNVALSEHQGADSSRIYALFDRVTAPPQQNSAMLSLYVEYLIYKKESPQKIAPLLNRIVEVEPDNSQARLQLLQYAIQDEDYDRIIEMGERALQYTPDIMEIYYFVGLSYIQTGDTLRALQQLQKGVAVKGEKDNSQLRSDMFSFIGDLHHTLGDEAACYAAYDSALVYAPQNVMTLNNYAYYLSLKGEQLDRAEEMSYITVQKEPDNATYLDTYAWILFVKGRYADAKVYIDSCLKNDGDQSAVELEHAGDIYYHCGETEQAVEYWKQAEQMGGESPQLKKKIKQRKYIAP